MVPDSSRRFGIIGSVAAATILIIGLTVMGISPFFNVDRFNGYNQKARKCKFSGHNPL
jgi:hypothetical protein